MSLYAAHILPVLLHRAMRSERWKAHRRRVVRLARGRVLEIGIGSALNLPWYRQVDLLVGIDPSLPLLRLASAARVRAGFPVALILGSAERLPFPDRSFDSVVSTWTLCSIPDLDAALGEVRRVLRPRGRFCFADHGAGPLVRQRRWQDRLTPAWRRLAGGCHLDRAIDTALVANGFAIERLVVRSETPRLLLTLYDGTAIPASP